MIIDIDGTVSEDIKNEDCHLYKDAKVLNNSLDIVNKWGKKADLNLADKNGTTALIYAVQFQNKTVLANLIQNKADKNHKDKEGKTAFEYAVFAGNEEIINLLK